MSKFIHEPKNIMFTGNLSMPVLIESDDAEYSISILKDGRVAKTKNNFSGGSIESVTGNIVDNTDPLNPVVDIPEDLVTENDLSNAIQNIEFPTWTSIQGKPSVVSSGETQADARSSIGAGTSNLSIGTTGTTAMAGNKVPTATQRGGVLLQSAISDLATIDSPSDITEAELNIVIDKINSILLTLKSSGLIS